MKLFSILAVILSFCLMTEVSEARRGCCSSHKGVNASETGYKDGTPLTETCAPYYKKAKEEEMPPPTILIMIINRS